MSDQTPGRYLTRSDLELVIGRAAEIEARLGSDVHEISEEDLLRIAGDVGLSEESVRHALAEHYADTSGGALLSERGWAAKLCGPGLVKVPRRIPESAEAVQARLESHFRTNEGLQLVRRVRWGSLWEPETGVVASLVRSVDFFGRGYDLAKKARAVEISVAPLSEDSCHVTLTADLAGERAGYFWGLGMAAGGSAAAAASVLIVGLPSLPALAAVGTPALMGISVSLARAVYGRSVQKMRLVLNGLLDRLEHDEPLAQPKLSWRDLIS